MIVLIIVFEHHSSSASVRSNTDVGWEVLLAGSCLPSKMLYHVEVRTPRRPDEFFYTKCLSATFWTAWLCYAERRDNIFKQFGGWNCLKSFGLLKPEEISWHWSYRGKHKKNPHRTRIHSEYQAALTIIFIKPTIPKDFCSSDFQMEKCDLSLQWTHPLCCKGELQITVPDTLQHLVMYGLDTAVWFPLHPHTLLDIISW